VLTGDTGPWAHAFGQVPDCTTHVTPVTPSVDQTSCTGPGQESNGGIVLADQPGVTWTIDGEPRSGRVSLPPGSYHVVAHPASGDFTLDGTTSWTLTIEHRDCTVVVHPVAPSLTQSTCSGETHQPTTPTYTIPSVTGVDYFVDGALVSAGTYQATPGSTVHVVAQPSSGYAFGGQDSRSFDLVFDTAPACSTNVQPLTPTVSQASCTGPGEVANGSITMPDQAGVHYTIDGTPAAGVVEEAPGSYVVQALADDGFTLTGTTEWTLVIDSVACSSEVRPVTPALTQASCTKTSTAARITPGSYTVPKTVGVDYLSGGKLLAAGRHIVGAGTVRITAKAQNGFTLVSGAVASWVLRIAKNPSCVLGEKVVRTPNTPNTPGPTVLPFTGLRLPVALSVLFALIVIAVGVALTAARRRRTTEEPMA
jgi:hypothetical protein